MSALKVTVNKKRTIKKGYGQCSLCRNSPVKMTRHHLVPVSELPMHTHETFKTIKVCFRCHKKIHQLFTNEELREKYYTFFKLKNAPKMKEYLATRNGSQKQKDNKQNGSVYDDFTFAGVVDTTQ